MKTDLRILHLEDHPNDADIVHSTLEALDTPHAIRRVTNEGEFAAALDSGKFDIVLSDFKLPEFDGISALKMCREQAPELPFIFVTGTMGEENAIESMQQGATDYVLKERLSRLCPAVKRAMHEVEEKAARKKAEEQFIQAQKLEIVGHLAGSVAHDFNNFLSVILGYNEGILMTLEPGNPLREDAEEIKHAADRAAGLTRQLLAFSRRQAFQSVVLDINEVVEGMRRLLERLLHENVELGVTLENDAGLVQADSGYIGQVLMNLVVNARDAMPQGGRLEIATRRARIATGVAAAAAGVPPGDYLMLSIRDTGVGMTTEVKARLFEPFFTTKPKTQGTGLGLATCQTIVKQCSGYITVESEIGRGTTFWIYFPRLGDSAKSSASDTVPGPPPRGTETLLIVEDEPSVLHLAVNVLRGLGYTVLSAPNGEEGLHVARSRAESPIQLVITDVVMPRMGGIVMAESLKALLPNLKVLFTSGYTDDAIARYGRLEETVEFLPKPYTPSLLAHKIRAVLDGGRK